ncbi:MAG: sulfite exporter TauE/SafE family protein [Comamonadaceae bacterium]|nr:MAG: sulfite exporter TauE/SafE family protein [Comamonadaceae bacterium]
MAAPDLLHAAAIGAIFFGAGLVKGVLGMGLPTFAMGLLGLFMPVAQAASLLVLPSFATNVWQAVAGADLRGLAQRLRGLLVGVAIGVAAAAALPWHADALGQRLLGGCLLAYGAAGLAGWRPHPPAAHRQGAIGLLVGIATGLLTGLTGVFVLPAVPYLQSLGLHRDALAQALGLSFTVSTVALAVMLALRGDLGTAATLQSALALLPALGGMAMGWLRSRMSEALFRRCFFVGLAALGGWLLAR